MLSPQTVTLDNFFEAGGKLSQVIPDYEVRQEQLDMARQVYHCFQNGGLMMVEAGTGIGKTLAYLIPALLWSMETGERVLVSTSSLHLQDQILNKDLPILKSVFEHNFKVAFFKGRENYICLRKLHQHLTNEDLFTEQQASYEQIEQWIHKTDIGEKNYIEPHPSDEIWNTIASRTSSCIHNKCDFFLQCYYFRARKTTFDAEVVVINHHLLMSHCLLANETGKNVLPKFNALIIDEAHELDKIATRQLSQSASFFQFRKIVQDLQTHPVLNDNMSYELEDVLQEAKLYFKEWHEQIKKNKSNLLVQPYSPNPQFIQKLENYTVYLENKSVEYEDGLKMDLLEKTDRIYAFIKKLNEIENQLNSNCVYWSEYNEDPLSVRLESAPIDISSDLKKMVFDRLQIGVLVSATLTINQSFQYYQKNLGIEDCQTLYLSSPFNYDQNMCVKIDTQLSSPSQNGYEEQLSQKIINAITHTKGGTLVLFTNIELMQSVFQKVKKDCLDLYGYKALMQGNEFSKIQLIDQFYQSEHSVLFGVHSFWTGIDLKGNILRQVIITRLPFLVPDHPLTKAKMQKEKDQGHDGFNNYYLPEAILLFRQGIGRLIRSGQDKGNILILDTRVVTQRYGKYFLQSLPTKNIQIIS